MLNLLNNDKNLIFERVHDKGRGKKDINSSFIRAAFKI